MYTIILISFVAVTLFLFVSNSIEMKKYRISKISENMRVDLYKNALIFGMISLILVSFLIIITAINPQDILFTQLFFVDNLYLEIVVYSATLIMFMIFLYQIFTYLFSKKARVKSTNEVIRQARSSAHHESFLANMMLPRSFREKFWFTLVSLSAGVSEEIVWRGLLLLLLANVFVELPTIFIVLIASILFGIGHSYQGMIGILKTSLVGLLLASIFILTGNLLISIALHFTLDFANNFLYDQRLTKEALK